MWKPWIKTPRTATSMRGTRCRKEPRSGLLDLFYGSVKRIHENSQEDSVKFDYTGKKNEGKSEARGKADQSSDGEERTRQT